MKVVGVDGCKKGWVSIVTINEKLCGAGFFESFSELVRAFDDAKIIAVDIPIGLPESPPRQSDIEARRSLRKRGPAVFLVPPRKVLEEPNYEKAKQLAQQLGTGVSRQAHALRDKILDVEPHAEKDDRIIEVHPEVSFCQMAGHPLDSPKKTWAGFRERLALLKKVGLDLIEDLEDPTDAGKEAAPDDVVDAAAAVWTASRLAHGKALSFPKNPSQSWKGRPIAIWR